MIALLKRWAAFEPAWCQVEGRRVLFGPGPAKACMEARHRLDWRVEGALLQAVFLAMDNRQWGWERYADGSLSVGHPDGLRAVAACGVSFTATLLDAYVQRLALEHHLLAG